MSNREDWLVGEVNRLKAEVERLSKIDRAWNGKALLARAEKAEAELAAERERSMRHAVDAAKLLKEANERTERLERLVSRLRTDQHDKDCITQTEPTRVCDCSLDADGQREALRPAAPDPTPSERVAITPENLDLANAAVAAVYAGSEQPDLPLGHPFECESPSLYGDRCTFRPDGKGKCGRPESAHRRKP